MDRLVPPPVCHIQVEEYSGVHFKRTKSSKLASFSSDHPFRAERRAWQLRIAFLKSFGMIPQGS